MVAVVDSSDPLASARALRADLLSRVVAASGADIGLFYSMVQRSDGGLAPTSIVATSDEPAVRNLLGPAIPPTIRAQLPDVRCPNAREAGCFLSGANLFGSWEAFAERPFTQVVRDRLDMGDQVRLLVYQDGRFLGWIGGFRRWGGGEFGLSERRRLNALIPELRAGLTAAETLESLACPETAAYLVTDAEGHVLHASPQAHGWLRRPTFAEAIRATVARLDATKATESGVVDRAEAVFSRLDGDGGVRYLVSVRPAPAASLSPIASLSPVQRQVAEFLVAGAQRNEVAAALGISAETVRSHVRMIYTRLGVADRLELARILGEEPK